jgi:hypothetical protein
MKFVKMVMTVTAPGDAERALWICEHTGQYVVTTYAPDWTPNGRTVPMCVAHAAVHTGEVDLDRTPLEPLAVVELSPSFVDVGANAVRMCVSLTAQSGAPEWHHAAICKLEKRKFA